jgi:alpha-amylase
MQKTKFIFCVHNHQPVGNFEHVLENSFSQSYGPFLDVLLKYPSIKFVMHFSGILLLWLKENKKDYLAKIRQLVKEGRIEMLSSGIFEPVLASLPEADRIGQVVKYNRTVKEITGYAPKGAWLTERIYEPHLPKSLNQAGIDYIVVDDYHFIKAGLKKDDLFGYYTTEEEGYPLKVFAGSEKLRYLVPFKDVNETLEYIKAVSGRGKGDLALFADDGEKFGSWPNTHSWVYEQHWLDNFCGMLEANRDIVETVTFSEYISQNRALGRVYLPTCSYMEMGKWSLPADAAASFENAVKFSDTSGNREIKRFLTGGIWRNYMAKYPESNNMHKKMLYVSEKIHDHYKFNKDDTNLPECLIALYKAQCNDAYWHGVFGGLYLPHLRDAIYRHLIEAEELLGKDTRRKAPYLDITSRDIDLDGDDEIIVESDTYNMYLQPHSGGTIYEYDYKPALFNIMNTLTRRKEEYHNKILQAESPGDLSGAKTIHELTVSKEEGLERFLNFDSYNKVSLIDHFIDNISLDDFKSSNFVERGDFVGREYDFSIKKDALKPKITLKRKSFVKQNGSNIDVELRKVITLNKGKTDLAFDYHIKNLSNEELTVTFGVEFNIMLLSPDDENRFYEVPGHVLRKSNLASEGELYDVKEIRIVDRYFNFDVCFDFPRKCNFYRFPVETVSISEGGFERIFQASSLFFFKMLTLPKDDEFIFPIRYAVKSGK